jgi:hypothetical protein
MTKAEITTLVNDISRNLADASSISEYYDETIEELAKIPDPPIVAIEAVTITSGTSEYDYPTNAIELLHVFHGAYQLTKTTNRILETYNKTWRDDAGVPKAWKIDHETSRKFQLYPIPNVTSSAFIPPALEPFGEDFPTNMGAVIYSDQRETDISDMLGIYIAFRILYKEFMRPSGHQDSEWAMLHKKVADMFFQLNRTRQVPVQGATK